jgi:catechol 2,3-dioxygenase
VLGFEEQARIGDQAAFISRVLDAGVPLQGASDHGVSEAVYLADPDGNGVELDHDRPREEWPSAVDGEGVAMYTRRLDLQALLAEAE